MNFQTFEKSKKFLYKIERNNWKNKRGGGIFLTKLSKLGHYVFLALKKKKKSIGKIIFYNLFKMEGSENKHSGWEFKIRSSSFVLFSLIAILQK